jgi:serine protease inhibitor
MKIQGALAVALLVTIGLLAGCIEDTEPGNDPPGSETNYQPMNDYVNSSNDFSFEMYKQLLNGDDNIFFSPYSIAIALGMAYEGARGETATEMQSVIQLPEDEAERRAMVRALQSSLNPDGANYQLSTANSYWLREGGDLKDDYVDTIENDYLAGGQELDFRGDSAGSTDTINDWVEGQTNDRIKDLIPYGLIDDLTYMVLTNAIYFKANWKYQFDEDATSKATFHSSNGMEKQVDMMKMNDEGIDLNYAENDDVQMLRLPYKDEELSMYILLPKSNDISSIDSDLSKEYISDLRSDMSDEWINLVFPKFKFEEKYFINQDLIEMGMPLAFDQSLADFSGMTEETQLFISDVIHQSFVEVNEEGTEAAAATAVIMTENSSGGSGPQPIDFIADHPFIFLIEHQESGQILFMGKVEDPSV